MKSMKGAGPGWHVVSPNGKPVSGPWITKTDGVMHAVRKGAGHVAVLWNGRAVVVA